jgi:hypothetical protein
VAPVRHGEPGDRFDVPLVGEPQVDPAGGLLEPGLQWAPIQISGAVA